MRNIPILTKIARKLPCGRGGFTLAELIVAATVTIIVMVISGSIIFTSTSVLSKSAQNDLHKNITETILEFVSERLMYAVAIEEGLLGSGNAALDAAAGTGAVIRVMDGGAGAAKGRLYYRRPLDTGSLVDVYGPDFYHGYQISVTCKIDNPKPGSAGKATLNTTVSVYAGSPQKLAYESSAKKPLLNYTGPSKVIGNSSKFIVVNYKE